MINRLFLFSAVLCLTSSVVFAAPEGFKVQEFALPPHVDYPAAITVAANGDVYVSSDQNGSLGKDTE